MHFKIIYEDDTGFISIDEDRQRWSQHNDSGSFPVVSVAHGKAILAAYQQHLDKLAAIHAMYVMEVEA
jgi:hypothetical protein